MVIKSFRTVRVPQPIPIDASPNFKIEIENDSGVTDDVTADVLNASMTLSGTNELGAFSLQLLNQDGKYKDDYDGGEYVNIYLDYQSATTLYFRGRIDKYSYDMSSSGFILSISGRDYPILGDTNITIQFSTANIIGALRGTIGSQDTQGNYENGALYNSGLTWHASNPTTSTVLVTKEYSEVKYLDVISDLSGRGSYNWYIYYDTSAEVWYIRLFAEGTVINRNESVGYGINIQSASVGKDYDDEFNKIRVYGEEDNNIFYLQTKDNTTSQSNLWVKYKQVNDTSLNSMSAIDDKATYELAKNVAEKRGNITALPLVTLKPSEKIMCMIPYCNINDYYIITRITTSISPNSPILSTLDIQKPSETVASFFKDRIDENSGLQPYINLNNMNDAYIIDFTSGDTGTHSNTHIVDGKLGLINTAITGTWESVVRTTDENIESVVLRLKANYNIDDSKFYVSGDSGVTWREIDYGTFYDYGPIGTSLRIKIEFIPTTDNPNPRVEKIALLHK